MTTKRTCSIGACNEPSESRGWCSKHYQRWRQHGDPAQGGTKHEFLLSALKERTLSDDCWEWPYPVCLDGYGALSVNGRTVRAHRFAAEYSGQDIDGLVVRHLCHNPGCFNPRHLKAGTQQQNIDDSMKDGRMALGARAGAAKLRDADVLEIVEAIEAGEIYRVIADRYGISIGQVGAIKVGRCWGWLTGLGEQDQFSL